jgi:hypothetical protein
MAQRNLGQGQLDQVLPSPPARIPSRRCHTIFQLGVFAFAQDFARGLRRPQNGLRFKSSLAPTKLLTFMQLIARPPLVLRAEALTGRLRSQG